MKLVRVVYLFFILFSITITPKIAEYATKIRGYKAYGGEYLIPVLGWIIATVFYEIFKSINNSEKFKTRREDNE